MAEIIDKTRRGWARFWALPWKWKGPVLAIVAVVIIGSFGGSGSDSDQSNGIQAQPDVTEPATQTTTAEPTPTAEPTQSPNVEGNSVAEAFYLSTVQQYAERLHGQFLELGELVDTVPLDYGRMRELSNQILATLTEMQQIEPPSDRWRDYHEQWQHAVDAYIYGMELFRAGLDADDPSLIEESTMWLSIGSERLYQALDLMPVQP